MLQWLVYLLIDFFMQVSYMILQRVSPVTHSVSNCVKRVVVIVSSVVFFRTPVSPINSIGIINVHLLKWISKELVNKIYPNSDLYMFSLFRYWNCACWSVPILESEEHYTKAKDSLKKSIFWRICRYFCNRSNCADI